MGLYQGKGISLFLSDFCTLCIYPGIYPPLGVESYCRQPWFAGGEMLVLRDLNSMVVGRIRNNVQYLQIPSDLC